VKPFRTEADFQEAFRKEVKKVYGDNVAYFKINDNVRHGVPDTFLCFFGYMVAIELKNGDTAKRKHESLQKHNLDIVIQAGGYGFFARSLEEAMTYLDIIEKEVKP
jgi:Na+/H+ antiporter NhaA